MKLRVFAGLGLATAALFLAGCETDSANYSFDPLAQNAASSNGAIASTAPMVPSGPVDVTGMTIHKSETLTFSFSDTPVPITPLEDTVKDDGTVTLMYNHKFVADGKTIGELQNEVRDYYVPTYYKYLTVTIKPQERFYFVGGEVHQPNRYIYTSKITVLQAIDTAGGFTDFARKGKVQVTRANGQKFYEDCSKALKHPETDREIFPGDKIQVVKRPW